MKRTIADARRKNALMGHYFFHKDTMRFWNSRIETGILKGRFFITSEDDAVRKSRIYSVRSFDWESGSVITMLWGAATKKECQEFIKTL